jgi:hypothetical protein
MPLFAETILVVFALIAIGYGASAVRLIRRATGDGLSDFVFTVAVPLLLFRTIATASFDHGAPWALWLTYFTAILVTWTVAHGTIRAGFGRDARSGVVAGVTAGFSNLVLLGIPFISGLYGEAGLAALSQIVSIHLPIMMAASIILYEWALRRDGAATSAASVPALVTGFLRQLFSNPLIIGILAGLLDAGVGPCHPARDRQRDRQPGRCGRSGGAVRHGDFAARLRHSRAGQTGAQPCDVKAHADAGGGARNGAASGVAGVPGQDRRRRRVAACGRQFLADRQPAGDRAAARLDRDDGRHRAGRSDHRCLAGNRGGGAVRFSLVRGAGRCFTFVYFLLTFVMGSK